MKKHMLVCLSLIALFYAPFGSSVIGRGENTPYTDSSVCQMLSEPTKFAEVPVVIHVTVKVYRHGTAISDSACPEKKVRLVAARSSADEPSVTEFNRFLALHRQSTRTIIAVLRGYLSHDLNDGFPLKQQWTFELQAASDVREDLPKNKP